MKNRDPHEIAASAQNLLQQLCKVLEEGDAQGMKIEFNIAIKDGKATVAKFDAFTKLKVN